MEKIDKVCIIGMMLMAALTGCGKEEAAYDEGAAAKEQEAFTESSSLLLRDMLGVGNETKWKERVEGINGTIEIDADLVIPDTEYLYTMEAEKYYVTAEDKKRIIEYFADEDTIKVDKESVPTKESIEKKIESYDEDIAMFEESSYDSAVAELAIYRYEQERLKGLFENAKTADEISEEPGDYSEDFYIGSKGDIDYTFSFYTDESRNRSAWRVEGHIDGEPYFPHDMHTDQDNQCRMTKEEAEQKALKLCEELGLPNMAVVITFDVEWLADSVSRDEDEIVYNPEMEVNGYTVCLGRAVDGVPVEISRYFEDNSKYVDGERTVLSYSAERAEVILTDDGILGASYQGILTDGEMGEPVKLLSLNRIKEIYREELEKEDTRIDRWQMLKLTYMKVVDENNPNKFRFIPAWRLYVWDEMAVEQYDSDFAPCCLWINAMDGSRIDAEKMGSVYYENAQLMGDYE